MVLFFLLSKLLFIFYIRIVVTLGNGLTIVVGGGAIIVSVITLLLTSPIMLGKLLSSKW